MKRVLIIGPNFYNFVAAVASAFESLGYDVRYEMYDNPIHPYDFAAKLRYKLAQDKLALKIKSRKEYTPYIERVVDEYQPSIIFLLNGDMVEPMALNGFRKMAKVYLWCYDSITRFPIIKEYIDYVDRFYCYESTDIDIFEAEGKRAYFLPQACDTSIYKPLHSVERDIDILFVGDIYHSSRRQYYLSKIVEAFPDNRIKFCGIYKPWYKNPIKTLLRERRDIYTNHNLPSRDVNELYNRAKVVVNIHIEQQKDGANPKFFEICGSGAYQVCDANPFIESLVQRVPVALYRDDKELVQQIKWALDNPEAAKNVAARAYRVVVDRETFKNRIKCVVEDGD